MTRRINARIDDDLAEKLERLSELTGKSASAIIKLALDDYYARACDDGSRARSILKASGFIGCASGDEDLSSDYKDVLTRSWSQKT